MNNNRSLIWLGTLGALSAMPAHAAGAVDTSQWKCETCPFEKGASGTLDVGAGVVSESAAKFGDFTGLKRKGGYLAAGGTLRDREDSGFFVNARAADLGLDVRSLSAEAGMEGLFGVRLGYAELPHELSDSARTPFIGNGGSTLTLPPGATLQPVDLGFKRKRLDVGASWNSGDNWTQRLSVRHDTRDGTQRTAGSFFANSAQLVAPVHQVTDQVEASTSFVSRRLQVKLAYNLSLFRNDDASLTWRNPFAPVVAGSTTGQLALAPDNQFHQLSASVGYEISPTLRASGEFALGRMTQDAAYLASTTNASLSVPALPASSLQGRANTLNASLRLSAAPTDRLRLNASYARDERNNETPANAYTQVSTDMFVGSPLSNPAYSFTQDRFKLGADYRGPGSLKVSAGLDQDDRQRPQQEVGTTRETTLWGRVAARPSPQVSLALKLAHAERSGTEYRTVATIDPAENPLLRKYNMADRRRDSGGLRADLAVTDEANLGLSVDASSESYARSAVGLVGGDTISIGVDLSVTVSDQTQLHAFAQGERIRSQQRGSQQVGQPDWWGLNHDATDVVGVGIKHLTLKGRLEIGGDLGLSNTRSDVTVDTGAASPGFKSATTTLGSLRVRATYRLNDKLSLTGSYWHERYRSQDWRLDGVSPDTVPNLLAFGEQTPQYQVNVLSLVLRYSF